MVNKIKYLYLKCKAAEEYQNKMDAHKITQNTYEKC